MDKNKYIKCDNQEIYAIFDYLNGQIQELADQAVCISGEAIYATVLGFGIELLQQKMKEGLAVEQAIEALDEELFKEAE